MPDIALDIAKDISTAIDEIDNTVNSADLIDVYIDEMGGINRRPGLIELCDLGTQSCVDGIFWWPYTSWTLAVSDKRLFKITDNNGAFSEITISGGGVFQENARVVFADFDSVVYAANGGRIIKIPSTGNASYVNDADAPTAVKFLGVLDRYLLATETGNRRCHFSEVNAPDNWTYTWVSKEAQFDLLQSIAVANMELHLVGAKTVEVWVNDGSTPLVRSDQGFIQRGTIAPYSFCWCDADSTFYWLDNFRHVVKLAGRTAAPVGLTMTKYISSLGTVDDAIGDYIEISGRPYYLLSFHISGKCLVFDLTRGTWTRWGWWNSHTAEHDRYRGNCFALSPTWNFTMAGDRANGKIYKVDSSESDDDGHEIVSVIRSKHYDHGSSHLRKFCNGLYLRVKRNTNAVGTDTSPVVFLRYRDNGSTHWKTYREMTLIPTGQTEFQAKATRLGSYFSRQWEIRMSDDYPLCLSQVVENVDIEG